MSGGRFADRLLLWRYGCALLMVVLMVGVAEVSGEREIVFPEMAALVIGWWVVDKRVWRIKPFQMALFMPIAAAIGVLIVRYSPTPLVFDIIVAFIITAVILILLRSSFYPMISACILPVLLHTESWIYPISVLVMTLMVVLVQWLMVRFGLRHTIVYEPVEPIDKHTLIRWLGLAVSVFMVALLAISLENIYCIVPPLIVAFVEFVNSKAGFRNRPVLTVTMLTTGALIGAYGLLVGHYWLNLPTTMVAIVIVTMMFLIFLWLGKCFAPAGALSIVPMLLPEETLLWFPVRVLVGSTVLFTIGTLVFHKYAKNKSREFRTFLKF